MPSHSSKTAESASSSEWMRAHGVFYCGGLMWLRNSVGVYWRMPRDWCEKACPRVSSIALLVVEYNLAAVE